MTPTPSPLGFTVGAAAGGAAGGAEGGTGPTVATGFPTTCVAPGMTVVVMVVITTEPSPLPKPGRPRSCPS